MIHYLAAVNVPQPTSNGVWIWFVIGLLIGIVIRGKF